MTDFLDFLKHKIAYVAQGEFKSGKFAEAKELFEKAVSTYEQGFKGAYLLQEPGTDKGIAVIFWEGIADMDANKNETCEAVLQEMAHLFVRPPQTMFYEVCTEVDSQISSEA